MNLHALFVCAAIALCAGAVHAVEPVISEIPGEPVTAVWPDGNRAAFTFIRPENLAGDVHFQVTENECTGSLGHKFTLHMSLRLEIYGWSWTAHSDPQKVGQPLFGGGPGQVANLFFINGSAGRFLSGQPMIDLPDDELEFDGDMGWVPGFSEGMPFTIPAWNSEAMLQNPQTGGSQNRVIGGEFGITMEPLGGKRFKLNHSQNGAFSQVWDNNAFIFVGDVVWWNMQRADGTSCIIGFKPTIGDFGERINEYVQKGIALKPQPFLAGSDPFAKYAMQRMQGVLNDPH